MILPPRIRLLACATLATMLAGGCTSRAPSSDGLAATPAYVAVARGRVEVQGGLLQLDAPREGTLASVEVGS